MQYVLLQKDLSPVAAGKLKQAFRLLPQLLDGDAYLAAADAYGILVQNLSAEDARTLQRALGAQGVATEVVTRNELVTLPPPIRIMKAECRPETFIFHDPVGREREVGWDNVVLIAAGNVRRFQWKRKEKTRWRSYRGPRGGVYAIPFTDVTSKEERRYRLVLEIFINVHPARLRVMADEFHYSYLGSHLGFIVSENFGTLVRDVMKHSKDAVLNCGAISLTSDHPARMFSYPSMHAFEEEMIWLFWRRAQ